MVATAQQTRSRFRPPSPSPSHLLREAESKSRAVLDSALIRRFNAGDQGAFVEIVEHYRRKMLGVALRHLRNYPDAEEICQDTFVRAHRGLVNFRGDSSLSTWLHRIVFNLSRNRIKHNLCRRKNVTVSFDCALRDNDSATLSDVVACESPGPSRTAMSREFCEVVAASMARLGSQQREILVMRNTLSASYRDIGSTLGINIGTVKSRIGRARESLRALMAQSYPELAPGASLFEWFESTRTGGTVTAATP